ncbi:MAG: hypothetical protein ACRBDX_06450 [Gammaproteobacteria bacterium]
MKYLIAFLLTTSLVTASDDIYCYKNTKTCPSGSLIIAYDFKVIGLYCDFDKQMVTLPNDGRTGGGVMCIKRHSPRVRKYFKE